MTCLCHHIVLVVLVATSLEVRLGVGRVHILLLSGRSCGLVEFEVGRPETLEPHRTRQRAYPPAMESRGREEINNGLNFMRVLSTTDKLC